MAFSPEPQKSNRIARYYDDVAAGEGWQGQATTKSIDTLKSEIVTAISRLGGIVSGFVKGTDIVTIEEKQIICDGFRIHYSIDAGEGKFIPGQIDIIALPVREDYRLKRSYETRKLASLKMALYMFRQAMDGVWFMEQLSPGYFGLMPFMLYDGNKTISQSFMQKLSVNNLLSDGNSSIDGEFKEIQ